MSHPTPLTPEEITTLVAPRFTRHKTNGVYLANHSLGRPLDQTADDLARFLDLWYTELDEAWPQWLQTIEDFQNRVARLLQLPAPGTVNLKTSAGQGLRAVLNALPTSPQAPARVVTTTLEFDSVDFILRVYAERGLIDLVTVPPADQTAPVNGVHVPLFTPESILAHLAPRTDLLVLSVVNFTTGQILPDLPAVVAEAQSKGARVLLDTYHSFGVLPDPWPNADFAIGGSYKYVHGGPGACWLALGPQAATDSALKTLDTGWFAKEKLFGYARDAARDPGPRAWWESTPPVAVAYQALAGLAFLQDLTIPRLRATSLQQLDQLREAFAQARTPLFTPENPDAWGAFALLPHPQAPTLAQSLAEKGVKTDARQHFLRLSPHPLNTPQDFQTAAETTAQILPTL